ncbi:MAG: DUF1289 domain-containing protein [Oleispira antarctica]|uniref:Fe-S protein n=1 Tax=Oleispira antarctica RB-8 TaxID=698738 RepID=R4YTQ2_OLEAN|nr:DUF1289 domain-containing protein [Oleispira antarctica]MBQ0793286.1 DUF1289 domain-containing protein [Oleispira antarctica]CCK77228.1 conserved hypothetical protein [Oleispira antarctica RB-8]
MIDQGEFFTTPNPCRSICTVNNKGFCKGCYRSREERFHWNEFTEYQKHLVVQLCYVREKRVDAARRKKRLQEAQEKAQQEAQFDLFSEAVVYEDTDSIIENIEKSPQFDLF